MDNRPIGVFDSGIGGLSILRELYRELPNENFVFFADQHNVPYGEKTKEELVTLTSRIVKFLAEQNVKMVVVACNTATCYSVDELRAANTMPIVGVVPAIKPAAERTKTGSIALIATPATAQSPYVTDLIKQYAPNINVLRVGCFGLENAVETGDLDSANTFEVLNKYVLPLKEKNIDKLVLGCTHYPFLKAQITSILGPSVELIDSGEGVAKNVANIIHEKNLENSEGDRTTAFFTNKDAADFSRVATKLLGQTIAANYVSL